MKTKSIFNLALKIFGIYFYTQVVFTLPQVLSILMMGFFSGVLYSFVTLLIYLFLGWFLTMKSEWITERLIREDEETTVSLSSTSILSIAIIFVGGYMLVSEAPNLVSQLGAKFNQPQFNAQSFPLLVSVIKILVGAWLIYAHRWIAKRIDDRAK